jgi:hypothetical protein
MKTFLNHYVSAVYYRDYNPFGIPIKNAFDEGIFLFNMNNIIIGDFVESSHSVNYNAY